VIFAHRSKWSVATHLSKMVRKLSNIQSGRPQFIARISTTWHWTRHFEPSTVGWWTRCLFETSVQPVQPTDFSWWISTCLDYM
jgi:hypothetical protein